MDDDGFPGECQCGGIDFERVVVQRSPRAAYTTDFVACAHCKTMFFVPIPPVVVTPRAPGSTGHGGPFNGSPVPPSDSDEQLKRDAVEAAKDYVKPGRHTPPRHPKAK